MKKSGMKLVLSMVMALMVVSPLRADDKAVTPPPGMRPPVVKPMDMGNQITAAVVSVDVAGGTLRVRQVTEKGEVQKTLKIIPQTRFSSAEATAKPITLADLKAGDKVDVRYMEQGTTAAAVSVSLKKSAASAAKEQKP